MKPLNAKERTEGFLKFTGLFAATIILVVAAIYFNVSVVPGKDLQYYKDQYSALRDSVAFDNKLYVQLNDLNNNLIQYQNNPGNDLAKINVANGIAALADLGKKDTISYMGKMCTQMTSAYGIAAGTINKLKESGNASSDMGKLADELKQCKQDSKDKDQQINNLTMQLAIYRK
jgi:hypothetical protein